MDFEQLKISERKIIVGVDFGTTYSGIAWAVTHRPERREAVTSWPVSQTSRKGRSSDKVPTKLRYRGDDKNDVEWGFEVSANTPPGEVVEWFKLGLYPPPQAIGNNADTNAARGDRDVEQLVEDYLYALGDHLMYVLRPKLGVEIFNSMPMEFVVTVPAIWSDLAKYKTRQAFERASERFGRDAPISLISEPEAAAIYALHGLDPHGLKVGDSFVVCDAGGGTVDIISYTIISLKPILEVQEAATGTGEHCGSTYLNHRFAMFLKERLGDQEGFDDEVLAEAVQHFETHTKREFSMDALPTQTWPIPVAGLLNNRDLGVYRGRYSLKTKDLQKLFEPVIKRATDLVKGQVDSSSVPISAVLLVGGFGESVYLRQRLQIRLGSSIAILQPANAWLAVVHGAVMRGLAQSSPESLTLVRIRNRRARSHYGTEYEVPYDPDEHKELEAHTSWSARDGCWMVTLMHWFIRRGASVSENEPFLKSWRLQPPVDEGRAPKLYTSVFVDRTDGDPSIRMNGNTRKLCELKADLSHIPETQFKKRKGWDKKWYYDLSFQIEVVYLSASTKYTLLYNDKRYETITAEYV